MGLNVNDSTTLFCVKYIFPLCKMIALHQNVPNCQNTLTVLTQRWRIFPQDIWMGQMCMTDAGTTQDNFILPAPPVGGLPISQDWLNRMKLVRDRTIPIILPSGKNILADTMFKISVWYTKRGTRQIQCRCFFSSLCRNEWDMYNRCGHDIRQLCRSCASCRRTANIPCPSWQDEVCSRPHHSSQGARSSSFVRAFAHGAMGCRIDPSWGGPIELFLVSASAPRLV